MFIYICIYTRRPLPERKRARLHCHPPVPSNPAESNQPLLKYLAISYPADRTLPILQEGTLTYCIILRDKSATRRHRVPQGLTAPLTFWPQTASNPADINENRWHSMKTASTCICMHLYASIWSPMQSSVSKRHDSTRSMLQDNIKKKWNHISTNGLNAEFNGT